VEFEDVSFEQFRTNLNSHRKQVEKRLKQSVEEEIALSRDRTLHPRKLRNARGELVFDLHPAKMILREVVANEGHLQMKPNALRETNAQFKDFTSVKFKERIYQEVKRKKFVNYLNKKREEKGIQL